MHAQVLQNILCTYTPGQEGQDGADAGHQLPLTAAGLQSLVSCVGLGFYQAMQAALGPLCDRDAAVADSNIFCICEGQSNDSKKVKTGNNSKTDFMRGCCRKILHENHNFD